MKTIRSMYVALLAALLFVAGGVTVWAHAPQQTGDQSQNDDSTAKKGKKKTAAPVTAAATPGKSTTAVPAATPTGPADKPSPTPAATPAAPRRTPTSENT